VKNFQLNESALDLQEVEKTFLETNSDERWFPVIQDSLYTCEEPAACNAIMQF
jgi:murein tripeptide amidase MpaA